MALFPLHGNMYGPMGEVDLIDTEQAGVLGGEVMTLTQTVRTNTATEKAAADVLDGYLYDSTQVPYAAANSGPHTSAGSGKVTLWATGGRYAITIDALAIDFVSGLTTSGLAPGAVIGFDATGKLAHSGATVVANTGVATFYEFSGLPSLVNTPDRLVGATETFDRIVIDFNAGLGVRTT
jgi:hypothetical protein